MKHLEVQQALRLDRPSQGFERSHISRVFICSGLEVFLTTVESTPYMDYAESERSPMSAASKKIAANIRGLTLADYLLVMAVLLLSSGPCSCSIDTGATKSVINDNLFNKK